MPLTQNEIKSKIETLAKWKLVGNRIERDVEFQEFMQLIDAVNQMAREAEAAEHHPDLDVRYTKLKISLTTHHDGGLTQNDFDMAPKIDKILEKFGL
jgi:4a-hydroxytetrahydrobiopterin dehydratase